VAVMVAVLVEPMGLVFTVNVTLVLPAGTVIEAGRVARLLLLANITRVPPLGAAPVKVTVPVTDVPPVVVVGASETKESAVVVTAAVILSPAVLPTLL
jgi:hypothetical protein